MKFATLVALVACTDAARIMSKPAEPTPTELAETTEAESAATEDISEFD